MSFVPVKVGDNHYTYAPDAGEVVINVSRDVFTAHWDSGWPDTPAVNIQYWTGKAVESVKLHADRHLFDDEKVEKLVTPVTNYGADSKPYSYTTTDETLSNYRRYSDVAIAVSPEIIERVAAYNAAVNYLKDVLDIAATAYKLDTTRTVSVVKGRKVPKGSGYHVTFHGIGNYGAYVNLQGKDGVLHKYVNVSNIEIEPDFEFEFTRRARFSVTGPEREFLRKMYDSRFEERTAWLVYADFIADTETLPESVAEQCNPVYFAESLRVLVEAKPPKLDTWAAERHNNFRERRY